MSKRWNNIAGFSVIALLFVLAVVFAVNYRHISAGLEEGALDVLESAFPSDYGPFRELTSVWVSTPPTLDGVMEEGEWDSAATVEIDATDTTRPGVATSDSNTLDRQQTRGIIPYSSNHATVYFMNDADYIYVAVDVTDDFLDFGAGTDDISKRDGIEILVSEDPYQKRSEEDSHTHILIILGNGEKFAPDLGYGEPAAAVKSDGSGYVVEVRWDSANFADTIGFDVAVNDSDDPNTEKRHAHYCWNGTRYNVWKDEHDWGLVHIDQEPADAVSAPENLD
ncbi:MAG: sugar-binding protein [bacterium]